VREVAKLKTGQNPSNASGGMIHDMYLEIILNATLGNGRSEQSFRCSSYSGADEQTCSVRKHPYEERAIKLTAIGYTIDSDFPSSSVLVCDEKLTSKALVKSVTDPIKGRQTYAAAIKSSYTFDC